jgi:hypothetical protein
LFDASALVALLLVVYEWTGPAVPQMLRLRRAWTNGMRLVCRVGNADGDETHSKVIAVDHMVA